MDAYDHVRAPGRFGKTLLEFGTLSGGRRVRIGLIGAGVMARRHVEVLRGLDSTVAAVCDADRARADGLASESGADVFADWRAMLDDARLDAVFVCTPPAAHAEPAIAAMRAGLVDLSLELVYSGAFNVAELAEAIEVKEIERSGGDHYEALLQELEALSDEEVRELLAKEGDLLARPVKTAAGF